ncbi:MAG TPA: DUF58 domain-containing protein [Blastocatellia bacterium]|nr:DUF58 domain-containing protein [Blastocatellia bacterium]
MSDDQLRFLIAGEHAGSRYVFAAPRRVPLGAAGIHLSSRTGSSLEFKDHREYQPGDDLRRIDWNAYARSDRLILRLYQDEVSPHVDLIIDGSRSMALGETAKLEATLGIGAAMATAATNAGFAHTVWLARDGVARIDGSNARPANWGTISFDYAGNLLDSLLRARPAWRPHGIRVLISDLFWMGDPLLALQHLTRGASAVVVLQIVAGADLDPPDRGNMRFVDSETQEVREIVVDAVAIKRYRENVARHYENWHNACRQAGAALIQLVAEPLVRDWRLEQLVAADVLRIA